MISSSAFLVTIFAVASASAGSLPFNWNSFLGGEIFPVHLNTFERSADSSILHDLQNLLSSSDALHQIYSQYLKKFEKQRTEFEIESRQTIFKRRVLAVATHNLEAAAGLWTWTKGINEFTDMTQEEFHSIYTRADSGEKVRNWYKASRLNGTAIKSGQASSSLDWRDQGIVTPIKNQGQCGSCYAFASVAVAEALNRFHTGNTLILSEQELVDCSPNNGCGGGNSPTSWDYMVNGIALSKDYPYDQNTFRNGQKGTCRKGGKSRNVKVNNWGQVNGDENYLAEVVYGYGPVSILINSRGWDAYKGGIFSKGCGQVLDGDTNHLVTLVGYTPDYWIIKNSWGEGWGEKGFMRLKRGSNMCDITGNAFVITSML